MQRSAAEVGRGEGEQRREGKRGKGGEGGWMKLKDE